MKLKTIKHVVNQYYIALTIWLQSCQVLWKNIPPGRIVTKLDAHYSVVTQMITVLMLYVFTCQVVQFWTLRVIRLRLSEATISTSTASSSSLNQDLSNTRREQSNSPPFEINGVKNRVFCHRFSVKITASDVLSSEAVIFILCASWRDSIPRWCTRKRLAAKQGAFLMLIYIGRIYIK